jgi:predicted ArsR family transcriptional regulator
MTHALARYTDSETAHQAAFQFDAAAESIEQRIVAKLRSGGMTTHALAAVLGLELVTVSPRMKPLVEKLLVRDSGRRAESPSGRKRIIWEIAR